MRNVNHSDSNAWPVNDDDDDDDWKPMIGFVCYFVTKVLITSHHRISFAYGTSDFQSLMLLVRPSVVRPSVVRPSHFLNTGESVEHNNIKGSFVQSPVLAKTSESSYDYKNVPKMKF